LRSGSEQDTFEIEMDDPLLNDDDFTPKVGAERFLMERLSSFCKKKYKDHNLNPITIMNGKMHSRL
jgi:hypothetical protein